MAESRGGGTRYPSAERARLLRIAHRRRAEGWSWSRIGDSLGLPGGTLRWWSQRRVKAGSSSSPGTGALVPVTVISSDEVKQPGSVTLVAPSGWRLEGLSASAALELLGRVGC